MHIEPADLIDTRLRVATWNVWWRFGPWEDRHPAIAETLRRIDADVIALQEVWDVDDGPGQSEALADALGYDNVFASGFDAGEASFGNAVLSRWPIAASDTRTLPTTPSTDEFRVALKVEVDAPRSRSHVSCSSTLGTWPATGPVSPGRTTTPSPLATSRLTVASTMSSSGGARRAAPVTSWTRTSPRSSRSTAYTRPTITPWSPSCGTRETRWPSISPRCRSRRAGHPGSTGETPVVDW